MYQVLARKYRPRNFNELVGQNHVSRALTSALERGRLHHAYLFTGTRGVGKTTIARILAKCLNCETGVTSTPCEVCPTCTAVNEGRFIDLIEIDAASRTKVEDTRELLDNVPYAPTQGRFKVYLIDEVHMLSTHSFNALLKTLEEPPEHVKFLFATTDPQKLPITVISRCLQFTLRPLAVDEITTHLDSILKLENIQTEQDALWQIAESAQGSVRDALSLTDQAIAYGQGAIAHQDVKEMLGLIDRTIIYDLILSIHHNQQARVSELLLLFRQQALDVSMVLDQLITTLHELALLQYLPELALKYSSEINAKIMHLSGQIAAQDLQLYYQIACKGRADLQLAVTQEQGFEMCVLRLLAFRPLQPNEMLVSQGQAVVETEIPQSASIVENVIQPQPQPQVAPSAVVEEDFPLDDDGYDDEFTQPAHVVHEPSSDDFLDEEDAVVAVTESESVPIESSKAVPEEISSLDNAIIFDANVEDGLFGFDAIVAEPVVSQSAEPSSDDFLAEYLPDDTASDALSLAETTTQNDPVIAEVQSQAEIMAPVVAATPVVKSDLMPQEILKLAEQTLEGEWTVEKWEYWFRNSSLSPAVQEFAQQGLMQGQINAESTFIIPKQYEQLLSQLQHVLEDTLKQQFPATRFQVEFHELDSVTPYQLQHVRKEKAYARAHELLQEEPVVKSLIAAFDAELQNVQLK